VKAKPALRSVKFGIIVSTYHADYTAGLLEGALLELRGHRVEVKTVPGAFEIPLQVQRFALAGGYTAILALGLIWQGKTRHAEEILRVCSDALMRISLEHDVPVMHEVLCVQSEREARQRCRLGPSNRGKEAALAALAYG
jgi:6,7-dimethyl-8-ribityllumazine synthase